MEEHQESIAFASAFVFDTRAVPINVQRDSSLRYMGIPQFAYVTRRFEMGTRVFSERQSRGYGGTVCRAGILAFRRVTQMSQIDASPQARLPEAITNQLAYPP